MRYEGLSDAKKLYKKYSIKPENILPHLTEEEIELYDNGKYTINGNANSSIWRKMHSLWDKIESLVVSNTIDIDEQEYVYARRIAPSFISDDLGIQGVMNHANGKVYDSKSQYHADLKASGHVVMEAGMGEKKRETRGDFDVSRELKAAAQQHGLLN